LLSQVLALALLLYPPGAQLPLEGSHMLGMAQRVYRPVLALHLHLPLQGQAPAVWLLPLPYLLLPLLPLLLLLLLFLALLQPCTYS
jgi:hypothetical protein